MQDERLEEAFFYFEFPNIASYYDLMIIKTEYILMMGGYEVNSIFGNQFSVANKSLEFLWKKQQVTSNNIANVDTPKFKAQYVTFEETFRSKLSAASKTGNASEVQKAIQGSTYRVNDTNTESARLDGNNVNQDSEMVELTRTALQYQYQLSSVNSDITRLRSVIKGQ